MTNPIRSLSLALSLLLTSTLALPACLDDGTDLVETDDHEATQATEATDVVARDVREAPVEAPAESVDVDVAAEDTTTQTGTVCTCDSCEYKGPGQTPVALCSTPYRNGVCASKAFKITLPSGVSGCAGLSSNGYTSSGYDYYGGTNNCTLKSCHN